MPSQEVINKYEIGICEVKMATKHVVVLPYDEQWKQNFIMIKDKLTSAVGQLAMRIEHVGSTSVEGLSAKPIMGYNSVRLDTFTQNPFAQKLYRHNGYESRGYADWRKGRFDLMEKKL